MCHTVEEVRGEEPGKTDIPGAETAGMARSGTRGVWNMSRDWSRGLE